MFTVDKNNSKTKTKTLLNLIFYIQASNSTVAYA